ncbi:dihydropteroate synthase [Halorubrum cibi]|uniref:Probable bifunctional folylpolyglutamate synthase/dihydropteroate synthase n=1 Tax=Halorubrum cibi TaxID=413815 RepID=A0A521AVY9_9EURY|nr:dihydropteroate synthase [Halorubrum cibi]SMO38977.1 dihydropteroate synthase [Halorubrum cibi]
MHYHEAANFLFDLRRFSVKPGTERVEALLDRLGNPESDLPCVQVAGSNGKGSTSRMVESVLREAGLSVGLYTSPHLSALAERIRVDGRPMTDAAVVDFVEEVKPWLVERAAGGEPLTFFEVITAMALHDFARRDVDVVVLEVGLGGEYDATSAVDPIATAVTNVSLEHTAVLGDTIAEIARTKSRIASADSPMVTACSGEALRVVREVAGEAGAPVTRVAGPGSDADVDDAGDDDAGENGGENDDAGSDPAIAASYGGRVSATDAAVTFAGESAGTYRIPLVGEHQATNAAVATALARRTLEAVGGGDGDGGEDGPSEAFERALADGLARATWPGRFEVVETDPLTVLDGAHNPAACGTLAETLAEYDYADLHLVYAAMHDKDHAGAVAALPTVESAIACRPALDRAEDPAVLAAALRSADVAEVTEGDDVADAVAAAIGRADEDDCVLVAGSLFAVAEARAALYRTVTPTSVDGPADAARALERGGVPPAGVNRTRDGVDHRVRTLRLRGDRARRVAATLRTVGGEAAVGGVGADGRGSDVDGGGSVGGELSPVTLAGSLAEFRELCERLEVGGDGLAGVAADLRTSLGIDGNEEKEPDPVDDYPWSDGTAVMGILNVTPDSFHDGGRHEGLSDAIAGAERMVEAGVDVIDVGGESTRPGAERVPADEEIARVVPTIEAVREVPAVADGNVLVSVDTRKPAVAEAALEAGADVINDVTGLEDPRMREVVADAECPVVVMHSVDAPVDPENDPEYDDVVADVIADLRERLALAEVAGIDRDRVIVDPGLGFGKSAGENFELLGRIDEFTALGCPVLVGHSYKSLYDAVGLGPEDREHATVAATAVAAERGADVVRVHDVAENRAAVDVVAAATDPEHGE